MNFFEVLFVQRLALVVNHLEQPALKLADTDASDLLAASAFERHQRPVVAELLASKLYLMTVHVCLSVSVLVATSSFWPATKYHRHGDCASGGFVSVSSAYRQRPV